MKLDDFVKSPPRLLIVIPAFAGMTRFLTSCDSVNFVANIKPRRKLPRKLRHFPIPSGILGSGRAILLIIHPKRSNNARFPTLYRRF